MVIAITGGIGAGKTKVLEIFSSLGAATISADDIVHALLKREDIKFRISKAFGQEIIEKGEINRKKLAKIVFSSRERTRVIEEILHPYVFQEIDSFIKHNEGRIIVAEIPLLFETGTEKDFDYTVTVVSDFNEIIKRLSKKGFTREDILERLSHQLPIEEKIRRADFVVDNSDGIEETRRQVERIWKEIWKK